MPVVSIYREQLFKRLGQRWTEKDFDEVCFEFGVELDDVTSEEMMKAKERGEKMTIDQVKPEDVIYRIDIPANRYDLLCIEGFSRAMRVFLEKEKLTNYTLSSPGSKEKFTVSPSTKVIRPFVVAAILRNISFTAESYASFIAYQDKLHQNICRHRKLVAIGTHDLDTLKGPFTYEALEPEKIEFIPLNQTKSMNAKEMMSFYKGSHLEPYLPLISNSPVFPVIKDSKGVILSLPPIINGDHSKITLETKNVLIECTALDLTKAHIVLQCMVTAFSDYCSPKSQVEPVDIDYGTQESRASANYTSPDLAIKTWEVDGEYINTSIGIEITAEEMAKLASRMQLEAHPLPKNPGASVGSIKVSVPPFRSDVMHPCDIMEDVAISYGFNKIKATLPTVMTIGKELPLNVLTDQLRAEIASAGYSEMLTFALVGKDDNFENLRRTEPPVSSPAGRAVKLTDSATVGFDAVRTTLIPPLLKCLKENRRYPLPINLFEISDIVVQVPGTETGTKNERRVAALHCDSSASVQVVHGLLDRIMICLNIPFCPTTGYSLAPSQDPAYFPGLCADILLKKEKVGSMGVLHPEVLKKFGLEYPASVLEFSLIPFV